MMDVEGGESSVRGATLAVAPTRDLRSMLQQLSPSSQTLEARLMMLRQQASCMLARQHTPTAVLHPFYQGPDDELPLSLKGIQECVQEVQESVKSFIGCAGQAFGVGAAAAPTTTAAFTPGDDVTGNTLAGRVQQQASEGTSQNRMLHLVSLLREQSTHTHSVCRLNEVLEAAKAGKLDDVGDVVASVGFFPGQFRICAFADDDDDEKDEAAQRWPTNDQAAAEVGLKELVDALESIGSTEMQLEAFAEAHTSTAPTSYTLTLAARILVIDVDLSLERGQDGSVWAPLVRVRLSYATDSAASVGDAAGQAQRNGKLASVLQADLHSIAQTIFGTATAATASRETAQQHLRRLKKTVQTLKRLDSLSSQLRVAGKPDLFAVMDDACRQASQVVSGWEGCRLVEQIGWPYATIIYSGLSEATSEEQVIDAVDKRTLTGDDDGDDTMHTLHIDIGVFSALPPPVDHAQSHFVARLDPPHSMTRLRACNLAKAAGIGGESEVTSGRTANDSLCVRCFPFASLQHLGDAIAVLRASDDADDEALRPSKRSKA